MSEREMHVAEVITALKARIKEFQEKSPRVCKKHGRKNIYCQGCINELEKEREVFEKENVMLKAQVEDLESRRCEVKNDE